MTGKRISFISVIEPFSFHTPCGILVVGSSICRKPVFVDRLLQQIHDHFNNPIQKVIYCHEVWQDRLDSTQARDVEFHKGLPVKDLSTVFPPSKRPVGFVYQGITS